MDLNNPEYRKRLREEARELQQTWLPGRYAFHTKSEVGEYTVTFQTFEELKGFVEQEREIRASDH